MARLSREEVLEIVRVAREKDEWPDLKGANLSRVNLTSVDLTRADLTGADLSGAKLGKAHYYYYQLYGRVEGVFEVNLVRADLIEADLTSADLIGADLIGVDLSGANLKGANLGEANLSLTNLKGANLGEANLTNANLKGANLGEANLTNASLKGTDLSGTNLKGADLSEVFISEAIFGHVDMSGVKGLETVTHQGPSTIGIDTLFRSKGQIPEVFLRGAGVPEILITYLPSMLGQPIQYYSCFISYSTKDTSFAKRLHADLQQKGVRCWFAPEDLKIGAKIRPAIDESIRLHDKLLLVLSAHSVRSQWVEQEVETTLARERKQDETVLFPIRLDNTVMELEGGWPGLIKNTRNIGDFGGWDTNNKVYQKALQRLLRDLKVKND